MQCSEAGISHLCPAGAGAGDWALVQFVRSVNTNKCESSLCEAAMV